MSTLSPTRSRRSGLLSPVVLVPVGLLAAAALVGGALVLLGGDDDSPAPVAVPTACTVTPKPPTEPFTVDVYNATDRDGLAATTAEDLELRAFTIGEVANDPAGAAVTGSATVRYSEGGADLARWVAAHVPKATITPAGPGGLASTATATASVPPSVAPSATASVGPALTRVSLVLGDDFSELASTAGARRAYERTARAAACPSAPATVSGGAG